MSPARGIPMSRRLLAVTVLVAAVAVLVTAVAAIGFSRSIDVTAARGAMGAQAERLAGARPDTRAALVDSLSTVDGELIAFVPAFGAPVGSAAEIVPPRVVVQLRAGREASTVARSGGANYLIEARPSPGGGGVVIAQDAASVRSLTPAMIGRVALALLTGLAVAVVAALAAARWLGRPLAALAVRARRLAAGERGVGARRSGVAEIDQVDAALDALDAALARSEGRQREFLLSVSHEIRTPLTALRGYAEALADGLVREDELPEIGRTLQSETARLTRFTDDLLALARLEADDFSLDLADDVSLDEVVGSAIDAWRAQASGVGVGIAAALPEPGLRLRTDPHRLRQLVDGLLENALRVSPSGSRITISAQGLPDGGVAIEVADQGPGLTPQDAAEAFERGRLHERYRDSRPVGSGLGLSIAARLAARLGGTISAVPAAAGAVFRIELPARPVPSPSA